MSFGFEVRSDGGAVVVDERHITLSIAARGSMSVVGGYSRQAQGPLAGMYRYRDNAAGVHISATFAAPITSSAPPMVALIPGTAAGGFHGYQPRGGPGNWVGFSARYRYAMAGGDQIGYSLPAIPWTYVAARVDLAPTSAERWGCRIFGEQTNMVFDSGTPVMQLREYFRSWSYLGGVGAARFYAQAWKYPFDGQHGILVSNLSIFQVGASNFGSEWAATRFGFVGDGRLHAEVYGNTELDGARMYNYGGSAGDRLGALIAAGTGGPQAFAVKVPR